MGFESSVFRMKQVTVVVHAIEEDGLPDMENLTGRVAFIWDGALVSGWPVSDEFRTADEIAEYPVIWEASEDRMNGGPYAGVTHWVELPVPAWDLGD